MGKIYEIVIFTASLPEYANLILDLLDTNHVIKGRLFRKQCIEYNGSLVKDLSMIGRPTETTLIVDNDPESYMLQPCNGILSNTWKTDPFCTELLEMAHFLERIVDEIDLRLYTAEWNNR